MKKSEKYELLKAANDLSALLGMKAYTLHDGRAKGLRAIDIKNGKGLELTVLPDRGMDIPFLSYRGVNLGFVSKVGLAGPEFYTEDAEYGFLKNFTGGFLTNCGITYAGAAHVENGRPYGLHGPLSNTPAENVNKELAYEGDDAVLRLSGSVRQARVFGENVHLHRVMTVETEANVIRFTDIIENCGFEEQPVMTLYHFNLGYPMLDAGAKAYFSTDTVIPRTPFAAQELSEHQLMIAPEVGREEQCYFHSGGAGGQFAMLHNEKLGLAVVIHYNPAQCPVLCEWKCMRAGDYALGLEPTMSNVLSRVEARENGELQHIGPNETLQVDLRVEVLDDPSEISKYIALAGGK